MSKKKKKTKSVSKTDAVLSEKADKNDHPVQSLNDVDIIDEKSNDKKTDLDESVQEADDAKQNTEEYIDKNRENEGSSYLNELDNLSGEQTATINDEQPVNEQPSDISTESYNDNSNETDTRKNRIIPIAMISIIAAVLAFLLILLPLIKKSDAAVKMSEGKNEEAIRELYGVIPLFGVGDLKDKALDNIIYEIAEHIQEKNPKFSSDRFAIKSINDSSVEINNDYETVNFTVNYANDDASALVTCHAEKSFNGSEWVLDKCDIVSADYLVQKECDQSVPDEVVAVKYPGAVFVEKTAKEQLHQSFVYEYKTIDEDNPFYYANNRVDVLCAYNMAENKWVVAETKESVVSTEEIPLKEFTTAIFTIKLPEAWVMRVNENSSTSDYNGEHHEYYNYSYSWFASKEEALAFNEKDGGTDLLYIGAYGDSGTAPYESNDYNYTTVNTSSLGKGKLFEHSYNDIHYYNISFTPVIKGIKFSFYASTRYMDSDHLVYLLNQLKMKTTTYRLEVLVKRLNIRPYASTYGDPIGTVAQGQKLIATEAMDNYEGYRWYKIGEGQWVADLDGEYLKVTYR